MVRDRNRTRPGHSNKKLYFKPSKHSEMSNIKKREIETFQLNWKYYEQSFLNGNKTHVAQELAELHFCSAMTFISVFSSLKKEVRDCILSIWGENTRDYYQYFR